jgi:hypothetical protein
LPRVLEAGEEAGLLRPESALPGWWYRRSGAAIELAPVSAVLRPIRLRCQLHHPSLCLTSREPEVLARRRRVLHEGHPVFVLDPVDALELAITVAWAGEATLVQGRRHPLYAAGRARTRCASTTLDLRTFIEARHREIAPGAMLARAREWSCEPALRACLECIQMGLGFPGGAREWAASLAQSLAAAAPSGARRLEPALFRPDPIERLPQWIWPTDAFLARRFALRTGTSVRELRSARVRHLLSVLGAGAFAAIGFPLALLLCRMERSARRQAWAKAQTPQRMSDVNDAWRAAARVEQMKPVTPRSIALPPREEGARCASRTLRG